MIRILCAAVLNIPRPQKRLGILWMKTRKGFLTEKSVKRFPDLEASYMQKTDSSNDLSRDIPVPPSGGMEKSQSDRTQEYLPLLFVNGYNLEPHPEYFFPDKYLNHLYANHTAFSYGTKVWNFSALVYSFRLGSLVLLRASLYGRGRRSKATKIVRGRAGWFRRRSAMTFRRGRTVRE